MTGIADRGQATVELLVFLPLVLVAAFAGASLLALQSARERADEAARAGAMALLQDADALAAARDVLHDGERDGVTVRGRRVEVAIEPPLPLRMLAPRLVTRAMADAGPEPTP